MSCEVCDSESIGVLAIIWMTQLCIESGNSNFRLDAHHSSTDDGAGCATSESVAKRN